MKKIFLVASLLITMFGFGQSVIQRASPANTVDDPNGMNSRSKIIPRYQDTIQANTLYPTMDSAGKIIYTRSDKAFWYRQDNPKKWVKVVSGNNLSGDFFYDSTCNCYKIDTTSLMQIINNFNADSSITSISVVNDSTIRICYGDGTCVNFGIHTTITNISNVYWLGGDTIAVCALDTTAGVVSNVCDTLTIGTQPVTYTFQNWLRDRGGNVIEFGSSIPYTSSGLFLEHNTYTNTGYYTMNWHGYTVYDAPHQFSQQQSFQIGGGIATFLSAGNSIYSHPNSARLLIGYTADTSIRSPFMSGVIGDAIGYYIASNGVQAHGSYGSYVDDNNAKTTGILFHQYDSANTNGVTIFAAPDLGGSAPVFNGQLNNYKVAGFNTDGSVRFHKYGVGTFAATPSYNLGVDANGNVVETTGGSGGAANVTIGENKTVSIVDKQTYSGFPSVAWSPSRDTIFVAWKDGTNHASDGALMYSYSLDGGSSWIPYDTIYVDGTPAIGGTVEIGYVGSRLVINWTKGSNYDHIRFAYNNGRTRSFTGVDSLAAPASTKFAPYGAGVLMPSGKYMFPAYTWNSPADSTKAIFLETTDDGLTWSIGATITATNALGTFPQMAISETYVIRVEDTATTDANAKLVALVRSDTYIGYHVLCYSTGGVTWVNTAVSSGVWAFGTQNVFGLPNSVGNDFSFPAAMILQNGIIYTTVDRRGTSADYSTRIWDCSPSDIFTATPNFGKYTTIYRALDAYKGSDIDWGYGRLFLTQVGELKKVSYDMSVSDRPGVDGIATSKRIRLQVSPVRGNNYFEAFAAANQAITTGTETAVTTDYIWFDSDSSYNTDSSKIYVPRDGYYEITARVRFDTSSLGTYRKATLYAVDWGTAYGTSPTRANYTLDKKIIYQSTLTDFNYVTLRATKYLYKGMQIKLTVQHDVGSNLNILSSAAAGYPQTDDGRATIIFKKIN